MTQNKLSDLNNQGVITVLDDLLTVTRTQRICKEADGSLEEGEEELLLEREQALGKGIAAMFKVEAIESSGTI